MRVIAGSVRGHRLKAPKGEGTRPTEDRIKENVFNILGQNFSGGVVLDLFAGSGGNGIEFLSRGCDFCYFVDCSKEATAIIRENLEHTHLTDKAKILSVQYRQGLKKLKGIQMDYIYIDPPYERKDYYDNSFQEILNYQLLKTNGLLIIEYDERQVLDPEKDFEEITRRNYGNTEISIWRKI
ncbi:MAG: 16S rRNA (guanine(966)-N(2))-methyltransferase RsmD [Tissierellia bacterium]|nr:16S rRNA (guanine(966)-N(2))-methyltransferase RsmD [Tissierellia bacterium]